MTHSFEAVSLDVGGVLMVPDHELLATTLTGLGVEFQRDRFGVGHYLAMAAVDAAASDHEDFTDYLHGFLLAVEVPEADRDRAHAALSIELTTSAWRQPVAGSREGVAALVAAGLRLGVTSNSDGTIAKHLLRHEWVQVGPGAGAIVEVITDSGVVGEGKPAPAVFAATVDVLGLAPDRILHVGDSVYYDVEGAIAFGMQAVHMDPFEVCASTEHRHIRTLAAALDLQD